MTIIVYTMYIYTTDTKFLCKHMQIVCSSGQSHITAQWSVSFTLYLTWPHNKLPGLINTADVRDAALPAGHAHRGMKCESFFMLLHRSHQYAVKSTVPPRVCHSVRSVVEQGGKNRCIEKK